MTSPYHTLLHLVVDRLRTCSYLIGPPALVITAEEDEKTAERPGDGDSVADKIEAALNREGVAIVVYIDSVTKGAANDDIATVVVQVVENVVNNRSQSGSQKGSLSVCSAVRNALEGHSSEGHMEWTPLRWEELTTEPKGLVLVMESRFISRSLVPFAFNP